VNVGWVAWAAFSLFVLAMLLVDLLVFNRKAHAVSIREAAIWSSVWIALGLGFAVLVLVWGGTKPAGEYLAAYVIEKSLSMDNVFMFALILSYFSVPAEYQHRALFLGIFGALLMRAAFIAGGAALLHQFHFVEYLFGAFLVVTGVKLARRGQKEADFDDNAALRLVRRTVPMTDGYRGARVFLREGGRLVATPMLAVLAVIELTDLVFALDSIPAVFGVTHDPFLAFTSNAFAILGLRALYFLLAGMMERFTYLKAGLAAILVLVGAKMLASRWYEAPVWASLAAIGLILGVAAAASARKQAPAPHRS
jgi:TerC family integral membrane protein